MPPLGGGLDFANGGWLIRERLAKPGDREDTAWTAMRSSVSSCTPRYSLGPLVANIAPSVLEFLPRFHYSIISNEQTYLFNLQRCTPDSMIIVGEY